MVKQSDGVQRGEISSLLSVMEERLSALDASIQGLETSLEPVLRSEENEKIAAETKEPSTQLGRMLDVANNNIMRMTDWLVFIEHCIEL